MSHHSNFGFQIAFRFRISIFGVPFLCLLTSVLCLLTSVLCPPALAQGTAFTYQGRLDDGGLSANGSYDLTFSVWNAASGGAQAGETLTNANVPVSNGLFTVILDYGPGGVFGGPNRWLEIAVRTNGGSFSTLSPRQQVTAAPYSILAGNVAANGLAAGAYTNPVAFNHAANTFNGSFSGNGAAVTNVNALTLGGLSALNFWRTDGNAGTSPGANFLGTTDNQPLELRVNNQRALRLEFAGGLISVLAGTTNNQLGPGVIAGVIAGGYNNTVEPGADVGTISGGFQNTIQFTAAYSTIAGGDNNTIQANAARATIGGGQANTIRNNADWAVIAGGINNAIGTNSLRATIGGGTGNTIGDISSSAVIAGGNANTISHRSPSTTIAGGNGNQIGTNAQNSAIGGGVDNTIHDEAMYGTIAGGVFNDIGFSSSFNTVGGGSDNDIASNTDYSIIAGGWLNNIGTNATYSSIGGGFQNRIADSLQAARIGGGWMNLIGTNGSFSTIAGGVQNRITNSSSSATIAGGSGNLIGRNSHLSTIGGGSGNIVADDAPYATIPGGIGNLATNYAFAAGRGAYAIHSGAFVWADSSSAFTISSTNNDSVTLRASGGYRLFSSTNESAGVHLAPNGTAWAVLSDRRAKKHFTPVDTVAILEQLAAMPITRWHYHWENADATPHIGPTAQDFKSAFYPGADPTRITTQEADGVALAAIQGLNRKTEDRSRKAEDRSRKAEIRIEKLEMENAELKRELLELKQSIGTLAGDAKRGGK